MATQKVNASKRFQFSDLDAQRAKAEADLANLRQNPINESRVLVPKSQDRRDQLWEDWNTYFRHVLAQDPDRIWLDLCDGLSGAFDHCRLFLSTLVDRAIAVRPRLGPEEYAEVRTITSANTVLDIWKHLVGQADTTVLQQKRQSDPRNKSHWSLRYSTREDTHGQASVITKWIQQDLAPAKGLSLKQTFVKREATSADIIVLLQPVWSRADAIPCTPDERIAFHTVILLEGMGGWRPNILMEMKYRQVSFAIVRDLNNRSETKLVATVSIEQNKRDQNKARTAQNELMSFSVTIVPQPLLCLGSLLVTRAIKDKAFQVPFESLEDLLRQPHLDGVDYVPLAWREDVLDEMIIPLKYHLFWELWNRTFFVSGARERMRPYSMRVGAGRRLGALSQPLRNYILSNSTAVYERSYQSRHVQSNLAFLAFENHVSEDSDLFQFLQNACLGRDQGAPVYPNCEDLQGFERRRDIQDLRKEYAKVVAQQSSACPEACRISARISWIIDSLSDLKVEELRKEYFQTVDSLRSQGLGTSAVRDAVSTSNPRKSHSSGNSKEAATIGNFLLGIGDEKTENATTVFSGMTIAFLRGHPLPADAHIYAAPRSDERTKAHGHRCLLCELSRFLAQSVED
ncbi:hypothetical protein QQX98_009148 [Neonectria punicea]|uniref:Uncharacterized protein n=1 Tax=Neonectria punicea TaxID=979145 RepID=A0ABR1GT94_9HYPO